MNPTKRSLAARRAAHLMHAQGKTNTAPGTAAFLRKFEDQVDPDRTLPESERKKRADHALKAHMVDLRSRRFR